VLHDSPDPLSQHAEGPFYWWARVNDLPAWPKPAITDIEGRFTMHGVGRGLRATLSVIDPRFALQTIEVNTDAPSGAKSVTATLEPAKVITGRVTFADTGRSVPHALLVIGASGQGRGGTRPTNFQADADGRFRTNPSPGTHFGVTALPPAGQPYFRVSKAFDWPKGAVEHSVDLALPRGVSLHGRVTEEGSGQPISGAAIVFMPQSRPGADSRSGLGITESAPDGSFAFAVGPTPGYLAVQAPSEDYQLQGITNRQFFDGQPGGRRLYSHAFIPCDPKPARNLNVTVALRRGNTVKGRVIGPDGQLIPDVWIFSRIVLGQSTVAWRQWRGDRHGNARDGHFELHGLDPNTEVPVYFLQPNRKLGATVPISGKSSADGPITVRLEPCGAARARLVAPGTKPVPKYHDQFSPISMVVTPGPQRASRPESGQPLADQDLLTRIDPVNYAKIPLSDAQGVIVFPALIPGAVYRIVDRTTLLNPTGLQLRKEFSVKPGETLDLGDILIEKPPSS
jgi:hypothetical protein